MLSGALLVDWQKIQFQASGSRKPGLIGLWSLPDSHRTPNIAVSELTLKPCAERSKLKGSRPVNLD
jgi:hypothetical protein